MGRTQGSWGGTQQGGCQGGAGQEGGSWGAQCQRGGGHGGGGGCQGQGGRQQPPACQRFRQLLGEGQRRLRGQGGGQYSPHIPSFLPPLLSLFPLSPFLFPLPSSPLSPPLPTPPDPQQYPGASPTSRVPPLHAPHIHPPPQPCSQHPTPASDHPTGSCEHPPAPQGTSTHPLAIPSPPSPMRCTLKYSEAPYGLPKALHCSPSHAPHPTRHLPDTLWISPDTSLPYNTLPGCPIDTSAPQHAPQMPPSHSPAPGGCGASCGGSAEGWVFQPPHPGAAGWRCAGRKGMGHRRAEQQLGRRDPRRGCEGEAQEVLGGS